jgi:RNA polymerase sigma-70 factor (ECF subfamily)
LESLSSSEIDDLIHRARSGCVDSLGQLMSLYRRYLNLIARLQLESTSLQAKCSPSDVVQETFLQANRAFADFAGQSEGELIAWLRSILTSQVATQVRHFGTQGRDVYLERQLEYECEGLTLMSGIVDRIKSPSQSAIRRERAVILADALAHLPDDYREVLVLRHLRGQSFPEVARRMERSLDSVKGIWQRAIKRLRDQLENEI